MNVFSFSIQKLFELSKMDLFIKSESLHFIFYMLFISMHAFTIKSLRGEISPVNGRSMKQGNDHSLPVLLPVSHPAQNKDHW